MMTCCYIAWVPTDGPETVILICRDESAARRQREPELGVLYVGACAPAHLLVGRESAFGAPFHLEQEPWLVGAADVASRRVQRQLRMTARG